MTSIQLIPLYFVMVRQRKVINRKYQDFPSGSVVENLTSNAGNVG